MKNNNKKEITIDDLALMVAKGFDKMDEKMANGFKSVNGRLDGVEQRLDGVEQRLDGVEQRLDGVEQKLSGVEERLSVVEVDVKDIKANLNKKVDKFTHIELEYRVEKLEKKFA